MNVNACAHFSNPNRTCILMVRKRTINNSINVRLLVVNSADDRSAMLHPDHQQKPPFCIITKNVLKLLLHNEKCSKAELTMVAQFWTFLYLLPSANKTILNRTRASLFCLLLRFQISDLSTSHTFGYDVIVLASICDWCR